MKKTILILSLCLLMVATSCKKEKDAPTITGPWSGTMDLYGNSFGILFDLEQTGTNLDGTFSFDDYSGLADLSSTSKIVGKNVTINSTQPDNSMRFKFIGTVNDAFDAIEGDYTVYIDGQIITDIWQISRDDSKKSAKKAGLGLEDFIRLLK